MKYLFNLILIIALMTSSFILLTPKVEASSAILSNDKSEVIKRINEKTNKKNKQQEIVNAINSYKTIDPSFADYISKNIYYEEVSESIGSGTFKSKYKKNNLNYGCWESTNSKIGKAYAGNWLFRFNLRTTACGDNVKIYSGSVRGTWAETFALGWSYYGETSDRSWSYINYNQTEHIGSRQGLFKLCVNNNWACVQETRPWIENHITREGYANYSYQG